MTMTSWLLEFVKGCAPLNIKMRRRKRMTKKCKCEKCIHCRQIITSTSIFRVNCKKYGEDKYKPTYCDQYKTKKDLSVNELEEALSDLFAKKCEEYVRTIVERTNRMTNPFIIGENK